MTVIVVNSENFVSKCYNFGSASDILVGAHPGPPQAFCVAALVEPIFADQHCSVPAARRRVYNFY